MMASGSLLAPGASPMIGRMHEVDDAQRFTVDAAALAPPAMTAPATPPAPPQPQPVSSNRSRRALPFVGAVEAYQAGRSISVSHQLALAEDLYLADHHFVHASGIKPLSACFPVLPMTMSLEVMAETAACLAPGCGLLGLEQVSAAR